MKRIVLSAVIALAAFGFSTNAQAQNEMTAKARVAAQKADNSRMQVEKTAALKREEARKTAEC